LKLTTYLNFNGNCAEALRFYETHLGGKVTQVSTFGQMPGPPVPPERKDQIMHARITIAGQEVMASDGPPNAVEPMRSVYLALSVDTDEDAERIYGALTEGGQVFMKMEETFFAHRFGQFRDKFGVNWMVIHERPMG